MTELKIKSQINAKELYHFLLHHTYSTVSGFAGVLISVCAFLAFIQMALNHGDTFSMVVTLVTALLFLFVQPVRLYIQAQRMMENDKGYASPIEFTIGSSGISLAQGESQASYPWGDVEKVISTRKIIAIYVTGKRVFKIARRDVGEDYEAFKELVRSCAVRGIVKLK